MVPLKGDPINEFVKSVLLEVSPPHTILVCPQPPSSSQLTAQTRHTTTNPRGCTKSTNLRLGTYLLANSNSEFVRR